ncbi:hypothetical protein D3Z36_09655 [Lachnospiraceae bacterium]|nr:hypothetical protein [Lachnospiraceae bacterium]
MEYIFISILNMSISAGWLILAVMLLRLVLRKIAKNLCCILWALVGIRLICPWLPQTVFSLIPSAWTVRPDIVYQQEPAIYSGIPLLNQVVNPLLLESFAPKESASVNPLQIWLFILLLIWEMGLLLMIIYAAYSYWKLYRKVRESVKWKENIYFCDGIGTPFILGVVRPRIYLPSFIDASQAVYVEAHEKAHLASHDHLWKPLGFVLLSVYWFHPLCWAAYWLFCKDLELGCDERVIREFDVDGRKEYSKALLECSSGRSRIAASPLAFGETNIKERIRNVLNYKKPVLWRTAAASVLCIIAALCFLTNPGKEAQPAPHLFGYRYLAEDVTYYALIYSDLSVPQASAEYVLTEDYKLMKKEKDAHGYEMQGAVSEMTLRNDNFDCYILENLAGMDTVKKTVSMLREENERAWSVQCAGGAKGAFYDILQQKNGDVYLCYGYNSGLKENDFIIGWIFKMRQTDKAGKSAELK